MSMVVIGGSNQDVTLRLKRTLHAQSSNPVSKVAQWGGVGRNIAEALGRLDLPVAFLTALARTDVASLQTSLPKLDVHLLEVEPSPQYVEVLDEHGELAFGFAAMEALDSLHAEALIPHIPLIKAASYVIVDANVPRAFLEAILPHIDGYLIADGTSAMKVKRLKPLLPSLYMLKLNEHEAAALCGISDPYEQLAALQRLGVKHSYITTSKGVYIQSPTPRFVAHSHTVSVVSTTGAGDAFLAGLLYALYHHEDPLSCAFACSRLALRAATPIPQDLTVERLSKERKTDDVKHS